MEILDAIEKKMLTEEHIENLDKKMHNFATNPGSKASDIFKLLKERGTLIHERKKVHLELINWKKSLVI